MKADDIPSECIEEPRFVKVLAASLCSEIAETKVALDETNGQMQELKASVVEGWEKRKKLKLSIQEMSQQKQVLNAALNSLLRETRNRSIEIEIVKNRLDDATLCEIGKRSEFRKIIENYRNTWIRYKAEYESQPLAVKRQACRVDVKRATVQHMMAEYKMKEFTKMIKQQEQNFSLQIKAAIVDFSKTILQRWKEDKYLESLESIAAELQDKLNNYTLQLAEVQREIENKRLAEFQDAAKMPPPRLHFPFMCSIIYPNADEKAMSRQQRSRNFLADDIDTTSVNTLMLEEMCAEDDYDMNENSVDLERGLVTGSKSISNFRSKDDSRCRIERIKSTATIVEQTSDEIRDKIQSLEIAKENILQCEKQSNFLLKKNEVGSNVGNTKILSTTRRSDWTHLDSVEKEKREEMMYGERAPRHYAQESPADEKHENAEMTISSKNKKGNAMSNDRYGERPERVRADSAAIVQTENPPSPMAPVGENEIPTRRQRRTLPSSTTESSIVRKRYESAQSTSEHEIEISSLRETPPKMRKIDSANYSSEFQLNPGQGRTPQSNAKTPGQQDSSPLGRSYLPSCVSSSDNLSNIPDWPKISRGIFPEVGAGADFSSFQNWDNWSPTRELSVMSFSPSSFVSTSKNNDSPEKQRKMGGQRNAITKEKPDENFQPSAFFKTTTQKSKGSFL